MIRKVLVAVLFLCVPLVAATAASAAPAQYPPSGTSGSGSSHSGGSSGSELARTGSDSKPLVLVGVTLVGVGAVALVTSAKVRRRADI